MLHILLAFKKNLVLFLNKSKVQIYREEKQIGLNGAVVGRGGAGGALTHITGCQHKTGTHPAHMLTL